MRRELTEEQVAIVCGAMNARGHREEATRFYCLIKSSNSGEAYKLICDLPGLTLKEIEADLEFYANKKEGKLIQFASA